MKERLLDMQSAEKREKQLAITLDPPMGWDLVVVWDQLLDKELRLVLTLGSNWVLR